VEEVLPEVVFTNKTDGYMGVNYAEITAVLVEAIKEQQIEIDNLKQQLIIQEDLSSRIERLEKLLQEK
jgi:hypothetical protein